jgi:3-methyl-2-oxobutanoate hydroxymethyltransferase
MKKKLTIRDLRQAKLDGRQLTEIYTDDPLEAKAAEDAGIDILMTITAHLKTLRAAAPNVFMITTDRINHPQIASPDAAVSAGFQAMNDGADAVYTHLSKDCVRAMARERIPVVGHVGFVPYYANWLGGPRAIGKTAGEALQVYRDTLAYQEAGAIAVEMEIVPQRVAAEIAKRVDILIFSMGSGAAGVAQYLFATDVLGTNTGHVPRHSKVYANLHTELQRIQQLRVDAFKALQAEVTTGVFPEPQRLLDVSEREFDAFLKGLG